MDRCADYEDQIQSLKISRGRSQPPRSSTFDTFGPTRQSQDEPRPTTGNSTKQSRFSFLTGYRTLSNTSNPSPAPPLPKDSSASIPVDITLLNELERERGLRAKAEERVQKVDIEIEELSVQLFSQANEMVAEERRARAKLEERVELLERRDRDKMARLDRLEKAVSRVERVKALLKEPDRVTGGTMLSPPARK